MEHVMEHVLGKLMELKWSDLFAPDIENSGVVQDVLTIQSIISGIMISIMIKRTVVGKKVCIHNERHGLNGQLT